jgi:Domain of unknown function (DUF4397)
MRSIAISRLSRVLAPALLVLGLLGFTTAGTAQASGGFGWLRLAHLSPNTPAVDVYLYSFHNPNAMIVLHHVAYGTVSGFEQVPSGVYTVAMRAAGASASSAPVLSTSVDVRTGNAYTVAGMGPNKGLRLQILRDRLTTPHGKALVRIIQASLNQHQVTVSAGHKVLASDLAFAHVTSYLTVRAGSWKVRASGATQHTSSLISLSAGTIHTIVVLDDPGHLKLDDLVDAAGSRVFPAGAPATGLGGTAPRPAPSPLPWLLLAGAGVLAVASGGTWARRPRGAHASR